MCRANYFLIRNGEFNLSLIREIERLKLSRLTSRTGPPVMIREQDLNLALLRASLGTTAQYDPSLAHLRFHLPSGPVRPLLPSLPGPRNLAASIGGDAVVETIFNDVVLGTPLNLLYTVDWPLDMFLQPTDMQVYGILFAFLSSLRKTHTRVHTCWTALSNAQRARRRWTGLGEGGTAEDLAAREALLRCSWGLVREMNWFLDNLLSYVMADVIDSEFKRLKKQLNLEGDSKVQNAEGTGGPTVDPPDTKAQGSAETEPVVARAVVNGLSSDEPRAHGYSSTYLRALRTASCTGGEMGRRCVTCSAV